MSEPRQAAKPFDISKRMVWEAWKRVRANQGAAGVDEQSILAFESELEAQGLPRALLEERLGDRS